MRVMKNRDVFLATREEIKNSVRKANMSRTKKRIIIKMGDEEIRIHTYIQTFNKSNTSLRSENWILPREGRTVNHRNLEVL